MGENRDKTKTNSANDARRNERDARLKAALKANLGRRKAQARARADDTQDEAEAKDE